MASARKKVVVAMSGGVDSSVAAALLQICRHIAELREPERVRAWMQSIVRNEVRRLRRGPGASLARRSVRMVL